MNFTDIFIKRPVLAIGGQPADRRARPALAVQPARQPVPEDAERGRHGLDDLLRRRRADRRRLHHAAARRRDRAGAGHRLPVVVEQQRRVDDHRDAAPELRRQPRADRDQHPGRIRSRTSCRRRRSSRCSRSRPARPSTRCTWASTATRCRPTTSPTTCPRVVKPKLDSIEGVQTAELLGARTFALRAWLDADKLAAHGVTAQPTSARRSSSNNYLAALGTTKGQMVTVTLTAGTDLHSVEEFKQLVVKQKRRRDRAPRRRRQRHARLRELRLQRRLQRRALGVHRHQGRARGEHPRRRQARARRLPGTARASCPPASPARSSTTRPSSSTPRSPRS